MDKNLNLVWEDNPDTPITAQNLSKSIRSYSDEDRILFWDFNDSYLKLKANSKINILTPNTKAFFSFEDTVVSHNSKVVPLVSENISYRMESVSVNSKSVSFDSGTANKLINPSFDADFTGWSKTENIGAATISVDPNGIGSSCARIRTDASATPMSLMQTVVFDALELFFSFSFYYKSNEDFNLLIIGDPADFQKYWRPFGVNKNQWETLESISTIVIPASDDWVRYEVKNINIQTIKTVQVKITANNPNSDIYIDDAQSEIKKYCTSYTSTSRGPTRLGYNNSAISLDTGSLDVVVTPKFLNESGINTILAVTTSSNYAFKLSLDSLSGNKLLFSIYDTETLSYISTQIDLDVADYFIDKAIRVICNWDKTSGISMYMRMVDSEANVSVAQNTMPFTPIINYDGFYIGSNAGAEIFEGLIDKLKINIHPLTNSEITEAFDGEVLPNKNQYRIFENNNIDIIIRPAMLDFGTSYSPNTNYYIWIYESETSTDICSIMVSANKERPNNKDINKSVIIGGFRTDSSGNIIERTIWDVESYYSNCLVERFVTFNPKIGHVTSEYKNFDDRSEIEFNSDIITNAQLITNGQNIINGLSTFNGDVVVASRLDVDNIRIRDNEIFARIGNTILTARDNNHVSVVSSGTGVINLDTITVKSNTISTSNTNDILIQIPTGSSGRIVLSAGSNNVVSNSNVFLENDLIFRSKTGQRIQLWSGEHSIGVQSSATYFRSSDHFTWYKGGVHSDTIGGGSGILLAALTSGDTSVAPLISTTSRLYAGRIHNAIYNDLAECWIKDVTYTIDYNMVVVQTEHGVKPSTSRAEKGTVGVVSDSYGFLLNDSGMKETLKESLKVPVCISGRVKVRIAGKDLEIGDEVVSYLHGMAVKASWFEKIFKRDRILGRIDSHVSDDLYWIYKG